MKDLKQELKVVEAVRKEFPKDVFHGSVVRKKRANFDINKDALIDVCTYLKDELEFDHCSNITAIDRSKLVNGLDPEGNIFYYDDFKVAYHLWSYEKAMLAQLNLTVPRNDPKVKSIARMWRGADWHEREMYDLMGVIFEDHPDLRRIDLPDNWVGHPLRKDYQIQETQWLISEDEKEKDWPLDFVEPKFYYETYYGKEEGYAKGAPKTMSLRIGPQHPGNHGPFLITVKLDGEIIVDSDVRIGYLHRGQEKIAENREYIRFLPNSDRYCWLSSISNQLSYVLGVEEIMGIEVPRRAQFLRVIMLELNRIASHLLWLSALGIDVGALTGFFYPFREREFIYDLLLMATGNRMNYNHSRFGGVFRDIPDTFEERTRTGMEYFDKSMDEYEVFFDTNKIFLARTQGIGNLTAEDAINFGVT
ncbi:MAG: NADH-quinone oxidoreductase subunit C, partial [Candidatus Hydrothermarchaeales archaeon]